MKFSVITPTLNAEAYILDCLRSVVREREAGNLVEHVIVDGGSSDRTLEIVRDFPVTLLAGVDRGLYDAMNKGSRAAVGDCLGFLGADDELVAGGLKRIGGQWSGDDHSFASGGVRWTDRRGHRIADVGPPPHWMTDTMLASLGWSCVWHSATFVSRGLFERLGGFDISYRVAADQDFFVRALAIAELIPVRSSIATFRRTGSNFGFVHGAVGRAESKRIQAQDGPHSTATAVFYRYLLKGCLNASNPRWFAAKKRGESALCW